MTDGPQCFSASVICYRRRMRLLILLLAACALVCAQPSDVHKDTLANGMRILIQEDHNIPNVAMYFFFEIGSRNERPGITGISHFFEHMMFNGAKKYGPGQFDFQIEKNGGNNNAYTTEDDTVYTDWFPSGALDLMLDMEADRIQDLSFDPKIIESERGVVYSERRTSVDNSNFGTLSEQMRAAAYIAHPYHWPVVGWPSDIESWTMDDLKNHFRMGYAPNNCIMVVVGDVATAQVLALAKKYLEPIPSQPPPPAIRTKEPDQLGERRVNVTKPAQLPIEMVAFHVPETKHPDDAVLDLIEALLATGQSSRLYSRLVDKEQLALSINSSRQQSLDPGLLVFRMQPRSGVTPARAEKALFEELDRLREHPVEAQELRKAKNQVLASQYRELKTIAGRANLLGSYELFQGDYRKLFSREQTIEAVTAADIQRVARQYLKATNRTVATLIPDSTASAPATKGGRP
jgi:zinc protease